MDVQMSTKKEAEQAIKRLIKEGLVVGQDKGGKHLVLILRGGTVYTRAGSPSDWRAVRNMESDIRRLTRPQDSGYTASVVYTLGD
jgi:hypothetical protein